MNVNIKCNSKSSKLLNEFASSTVCNDNIPTNIDYSYCHDTLQHRSSIDYFFISDSCWLRTHEIIDSPFNLSNHLPLKITCCINSATKSTPAPLIKQNTPSFLLDIKKELTLF